MGVGRPGERGGRRGEGGHSFACNWGGQASLYEERSGGFAGGLGCRRRGAVEKASEGEGEWSAAGRVGLVRVGV